MATTKEIKDFPLKTGVEGQEDLLIQDNGITKRIKANEFLNQVNLNDYVTSNDLNQALTNKANLTDIPSLDGYATKEELNNKVNVSDLSDVATTGSYEDLLNKPMIPSQPTKISQLTNDKGYITSIPDEYVTDTELISKNYATETFVTTKIAEASLSGGEIDLSGYATKSEVNNKVDKVEGKGLTTNDYTNEEKLKLSGIEVNANNYVHPNTHLATMILEDDNHKFVTEEEKTNWNNKSTFSGSYNDLTNKPSIPTKTSDLTNDSGYIISIPNEYITETELNAKGYLTDHQDISGKADKTELHNHANKTILDGITSEKITEWNSKSNFNGDYNSLTNKPTIPTKVSELTNDTGFITEIPNLNIYQAKADNTLDTANKTVVGAINEINGKVESLQTNELTQITVVGNILQLTEDKYQYSVLSSGDQIQLPSVSSFVEIHLFFKTTNELTLVLPSVRWQTQPNIQANRVYELIFTYIIDEWVGGVVEYV